MDAQKRGWKAAGAALGWVVLGAVLFTAGWYGWVSRAAAPPKKATAPPAKGAVAVAQDWTSVDKLVNDQKFEEAARLAGDLTEKARKAGDEEGWTRGLIRQVQLRTGLHGYETAVRFLMEQEWPKGRLCKDALELFYAHSLATYMQAYSWEIRQREKVESKEAVDLKAWTEEEIFAHARKAFLEVFRDREHLGAQPVSKLGEYLDANNYPKEVRGTLRDAVSYLFAELLSNTSFWRPEESGEIYRLDLKALLGSAPGNPEDGSAHPLVQLCAILSDLETWHAAEGHRAGALEARLERLQRLQASFAEAADREAIRADLERRLPSFRDVSWWAEGQATLAEFVMAGEDPSRLVRARAIALEGRKAYPESVGGQHCQAIAAGIEAPDFQVQCMSLDGPARRSIQVRHKNVPSLFFRAYGVDLLERVGRVKDYNLLPNYPEIEAILERQPPSARWRADLPPTPDYESHTTYLTPPLKGPGFFVVVASAREDFAERDNRILGLNFLVSDLVLVTRSDQGAVEARVLSGQTGKPVPGAQVDLYRYDYSQGHRRVSRGESDADGLVRFAYADARRGASHFLLARKGQDLSLDSQYLSFYQPSKPSASTGALLYTDRSIYRPNQKLYFKVLCYERPGEGGAFRTAPSQVVHVTLRDPNGETVESLTMTSNEFGSAAGEFTVPSGRLLGAWQIQASLGGMATVRVEEYKRPTFEVSLKDPEAALRLNRPATLKGDVRYYFGLPVSSGTVKWRVNREPVYPWWWEWYGWLRRGPSSRGQTVATGTAEIQADGTFTLTFTPEADERRKADRDVTFRYSVSADVTDEGGETRSATRSFRLGFISVEARADAGTAFFREGAGGAFTVVRSDLNGVPKAGKGTWQIVSLRQPEKALLPADQPLPLPENYKPTADEYRTEGDRLRPRWDWSYSPEAVLRGWTDGAEKGRGSLSHDEKGEAELALPELPPGAYRLRYETADDFGETFETQKEFVVAGGRTPLALPVVLWAESTSVKVGETARFLALSALEEQDMVLEVYRQGKLSERRWVRSSREPALLEIPVAEGDRGGFTVRLSGLRDHQFLVSERSVFVPWDSKNLQVEFATFRDKMRPGGKETWRVTVKGPEGEGKRAEPEAGTAEILAYMYDKSLDIFAPHTPPNPVSLYPGRTGAPGLQANLGSSHPNYNQDYGYASVPGYPSLYPDRLKFYDSYGIGGPGRRRYMAAEAKGMVGGVMEPMPSAAPPAPEMAMQSRAVADMKDEVGQMEKRNEADKPASSSEAPAQPEAPIPLRSNFAETAFWKPQLLTGPDGSAVLEFAVPDSVTAWNVWVHAVTRDLRAGSLHKETRSVKDLMVRPYVPRFLREGDRAEIKVVVNNASEKELSGTLSFDILDAETNASLLRDFGLEGEGPQRRPFTVAAGGGAHLSFPIEAPSRVGPVAFKVTATSGDFSDGELRPLPVLPSRIHLAQSRFVTLKDADRREMVFEDLARGDDPTMIQEQMVVTVDAQLFYQVLEALPYLVNYPYECTEQTLNRFLCTGIVSSVYEGYPAVAAMAKEMSKRETRLETWDSADPNRKMALEETPWLREARGSDLPDPDLLNVLDPRVARAERESALAKLKKSQTALGGFPWWPGGPPSPYMTLYIVHGFSKGLEFGVEAPKQAVVKAFDYLHRHYLDECVKEMMAHDSGWEFVTFLNYTLSNFPDNSWTGGVFTGAERDRMLAFSFKHWRDHSPYLKGLLALTLKRAGRPADAKLVFDSVMDSAKTTRDEGTFWAPEDRSWLWYNDTIETHAFALRVLMELQPTDPRRDGLVQWILLNKKLNHWKSTRATSEVIYSLVHHLKQTGGLGVREEATVSLCNQRTTFVFEPDRYTGKKNQILIPGPKVDPATCSTVVVEKGGKGYAFASATWMFSTEKLPEEARGDFFSVTRRFFKREASGSQFVLRPIEEGATLQAGDQIEIHISLRSKHEAEYVHLRDPRGAGFEPENPVSRYRWDLGIGWYEETRDSGTNFFFEWLPAGEYTFKYRLRANMAGAFRVGPATVQSMYAPEFNAYSSGAVLSVEGEGAGEVTD